MILVRAPFSIFNGYEHAQAGNTIAVSPEQARRVLVAGGTLVSADGTEPSLAEQVEIVRLRLDDLPEEGGRDERQEELAALASQ